MIHSLECIESCAFCFAEQKQGVERAYIVPALASPQMCVAVEDLLFRVVSALSRSSGTHCRIQVHIVMIILYGGAQVDMN